MLTKALLVAFSVTALTGCAIVPLYTAANEKRDGAVAPTRATLRVADDLRDRPFVGIAMSGGGARAANFAAAVLLELEELGMLQHASVISSVSGSSLTAAYYGLFARDRDRWSREAVRERFLTDFQTHWLVWWFNPWNVVRYWSTRFDRSDIMKQVFDTYLFEGRTFADMGGRGPRILINATSLPEVKRFVFTDEALEALGSRLDRYRLSHAVMASGAFPGAFHNVTLENFARAGRYEHLFDGGPSDNLGVEALEDLLRVVRPPACFLFIVDAYPYQIHKGARQPDTRSVLDYAVDQNVSDAADVFLTLRRQATLRELGYARDRQPGEVPHWVWRSDGFTCEVWHFTFQSFVLREGEMARRAESGTSVRNVRRQLERLRRVNQIPTRYRLEGISGGPGQSSEKAVQSLLFQAATHLVREDPEPLRSACAWFAKHFPHERLSSPCGQ